MQPLNFKSEMTEAQLGAIKQFITTSFPSQSLYFSPKKSMHKLHLSENQWGQKNTVSYKVEQELIFRAHDFFKVSFHLYVRVIESGFNVQLFVPFDGRAAPRVGRIRLRNVRNGVFCIDTVSSSSQNHQLFCTRSLESMHEAKLLQAKIRV